MKSNLFGEEVKPSWAEAWEGMPEFQQEDQTPCDSIKVQFHSEEDRKAFLKLLGENPERRRSIWFPKLPQLSQSIRNAPSTKVPPNKYPVYVISKGRWDSRLTCKTLEKLGMSYYMVVESTEYQEYAAVIDSRKILKLPFHDLGKGSIPARNWVWDHAVKTGVSRHWILDDNINGFYRLNNNTKVRMVSENPFTEMEQFSDRYQNVAISGPNYEFFADRRQGSIPPFYLNTRVYSCILIKNDIPYRWRGRYNEDTDLCLRVLKDGWCTVLFNAFLAKKLPTMQMKGGNTDELYQGKGRLEMAKSLQKQHPALVKIAWKWGRPQHSINYRVFRKNELIPVE